MLDNPDTPSLAGRVMTSTSLTSILERSSISELR